MVMGDAMAVALMKLNNFKSENFAQFHPGGNLGKKLVTTVASVMIKNNLPSCNKGVSIKEVIHKITDGKCGLVVVVDEGAVVGIITDGDIRRFMNSHEGTFFALKVDEVMTKKPKTIRSNKKLIEAGDIMRENNIHALVVDDGVGSMVGIVQMHHIANIAV
jgi:arabinose-5-phosphate isomerase